MPYTTWRSVSMSWMPGDRVSPMHGDRRGVVTEVVLRKDEVPLYYVQWDDNHPRVVHSVNPDELRAAPPIAPEPEERWLEEHSYLVYEVPSVRASLKRLKWGEDLHKHNLAKKKHKARADSWARAKGYK